MFLSLPNHWIIILNVIGIPLVHFGMSWLFTRLPGTMFDPTLPPFSRLPGESCRLYEKLFGVRLWKDKLPDAGPWFGGFAKKQLGAKDPQFLQTFLVETCRSEAAHHAQVLAILTFIAWNPWPAALVIAIYAVLSNITCIILQRHNRLRLAKILARKK